MIELLLPELGVKITITIEKYPPPTPPASAAGMPPLLNKHNTRTEYEQRKTA